MPGKGPKPVGEQPTAEAPAGESAELYRRYVAGDEQAADALFHRYLGRLVRLARSRLSRKLAARLDPDDVVMSAYRSFFVGARGGRFAVERSGDLWRLLAEITLHKLYRQTARHRARRRSVDVEVAADGRGGVGFEAFAREPTPDEAVAAAEELEQVLAELPPLARRALELRLQGEELRDIAKSIGRAERTTRRLLDDVKRRLLERLGPSTSRVRKQARSPSRRSVTPAEPPQLAPPEVRAPLVFSDYLLHKQLGTGASGKVYRATHRPSGRQVAVKYLKKSHVRDAGAIGRFAREAEVVMRLRHPRIVPVEGLGRTPSGALFIVMPLLEGGDLGQRLAARPVPIEDAVRWVQEAAEAIEFAHQSGIVHCDLKPSNLLLDGDGHVRVTDFGLARNLRDGDDTSPAIAGTPAFMAPEQIDAVWGEIGPHTDVYGLGAVLFTLLSGRPPFDGQRVPDVLAQVVSAVPVDLATKEFAAVPPVLIDVVARSLTKPPSQRFTSAADFAAALARLEPFS